MIYYLLWIMNLKNVKRGRIKEFADKYNADYFKGKKPWEIKCGNMSKA